MWLLLVVGVLCENCIVDASIPKHGVFEHCCLGCVISYILCVLCSSRQHDGQAVLGFVPLFCCLLLCWLCVRYLGRMVDALAC